MVYAVINWTAKLAVVQSYPVISKAVQTVRCKAYILNPDTYFVKSSTRLTTYIYSSTNSASDELFDLMKYCSTGAAQQF